MTTTRWHHTIDAKRTAYMQGIHARHFTLLCSGWQDVGPDAALREPLLPERSEVHSSERPRAGIE